MHAQRVERTIYRLSGIKDNLKEAEQILLKNIAALRKANPYQKPKGTAYARRRLRSKPLWQKVVSAHALIKDADDESDTEEDSAVIQALMKMRPLTQALMKLSPDDAKIEYERHDQNVSPYHLPVHQKPQPNAHSSATSSKASVSSPILSLTTLV